MFRHDDLDQEPRQKPRWKRKDVLHAEQTCLQTLPLWPRPEIYCRRFLPAQPGQRSKLAILASLSTWEEDREAVR